MYAQVINVTPQIAEKWLEKNTNNRSLSVHRVSAYANAMKNGDWELNGQTIVFDTDGTLKDGQHRLAAVKKSGATVPMLVVFDSDKNAYVFDRGRNRNVSDCLKINGLDKTISSNTVVGTAKLSMYITTGNSVFSEAEVNRWILENEDAIRSVYTAVWNSNQSGSTRISVRTSANFLAAIGAWYSGVSAEQLRRFFDIVRSGMYESKKDIAAIVYRNDIIAGYTKRNTRIKDRYLVYMAQKAISDFVNGYERKVTYKNTMSPTYYIPNYPIIADSKEENK